MIVCYQKQRGIYPCITEHFAVRPVSIAAELTGKIIDSELMIN